MKIFKAFQMHAKKRLGAFEVRKKKSLSHLGISVLGSELHEPWCVVGNF